MELRLAVVQPETLTGAEAPKNVDRAVAYIRQAARDGAKLVMLPETYPGPYTVPVNYSPHEALAAVAGEEKVYVVGGAVEDNPPDDVGPPPRYNCLYLYRPDGPRIGKGQRPRHDLHSRGAPARVAEARFLHRDRRSRAPRVAA